MTGLTSIEIDGESIGLKFGLEANRMFLEHIGSDFGRIDKKHYNETDVAALLHAGYVNYCTTHDETPLHKIGYFIGWVEDNLEEKATEFERVAHVYEESKHTKRMIRNMNDATEELKKKMKTLTGSSSNLSVTENLASEATGSSLT